MIRPVLPRFLVRRWTPALVAVMSCPVTAAAPQAVEPGSTVHFPFNAQHDGAGSYEAAGQRTKFLTLRVPIALKKLTAEDWGVRLRLTGLVGAHSFDALELDSLRLTSLGIIPGVEALIPIGPGRTLRPYADLGPASSLDTDEAALVWALGVRAELVFPWRLFLFGLEPGLAMSGAESNRQAADSTDDYIDAALKMEARHPMWFTMRGHQPDVGVSLKYGYYIDALQFTSVGGQVADFAQHWELGVSFGFREPRPKMLIFRVPRVGIGYRIGNGPTGLRITIGGDWISPGIRWE